MKLNGNRFISYKTLGVSTVITLSLGVIGHLFIKHKNAEYSLMKIKSILEQDILTISSVDSLNVIDQNIEYMKDLKKILNILNDIISGKIKQFVYEDLRPVKFVNELNMLHRNCSQLSQESKRNMLNETILITNFLNQKINDFSDIKTLRHNLDYHITLNLKSMPQQTLLNIAKKIVSFESVFCTPMFYCKNENEDYLNLSFFSNLFKKDMFFLVNNECYQKELSNLMINLKHNVLNKLESLKKLEEQLFHLEDFSLEKSPFLIKDIRRAFELNQLKFTKKIKSTLIQRYDCIPLEKKTNYLKNLTLIVGNINAFNSRCLQKSFFPAYYRYKKYYWEQMDDQEINQDRDIEEV